MVHAKNYETAFTFVKVIQRKQLASFFHGHGVYPDICPHGKMFPASIHLKCNFGRTPLLKRTSDQTPLSGCHENNERGLRGDSNNSRTVHFAVVES